MSNGNRGKYIPTPVNVVINGETKTWVGRGNKPKWLKEYEAVNGPVRGAKAASKTQAT
jgi:DNA-binding protein H-NS